MMNVTLQLVFAAGIALFMGSCRDTNEKNKAAEAPTTLATAKRANSAAWKAATTLPPSLPGSVDLRRGIEQLLPAEGYLRLVSVKPGRAQPAILALPVLWRTTNADDPAVAPGYRIPFEAVVQWTPTGYQPGEPIPTSIILYEPAPQDSLASFSVAVPDAPGVTGMVEKRAKQTRVRANEPVTIHGVLYAYTAASAGQHGLVVYPYRNPTGLPDPKTMVQIPFN